MKHPKKKRICHQRCMIIGVLIALYIALGSYSVTFIPNPFLNNFPIAFNMTIVVFAGIIYGRKTGVTVGVLGAIFAILFALVLKPYTQSYLYAVANIIPHGIMGYLAGYLGENKRIFLGSLSIIVGHFLNIIAFMMLSLFTIERINAVFWRSIAYETLIDIVAINMVCMIFLISFPFIKERW